jgi:hypothetical protein
MIEEVSLVSVIGLPEVSKDEEEDTSVRAGVLLKVSDDDSSGIEVVLSPPDVLDKEEEEDSVGITMVIVSLAVGEPDAHSHDVLDSEVVLTSDVVPTSEVVSIDVSELEVRVIMFVEVV